VSLAWAALLVIAATALAVAAMLLVRRHSPEGGFFADGDRAAGFFGVLATSFSVLLAFVVFLAFTSYDKARSGAEQEATDLAQQFETSRLLPRAVSDRLSGQLVCYGRAVVSQEWPAMRRGQSPDFNPWGLPLFRTLLATKPVTPVEQASYAKWLDQRADREQSRLDRLAGTFGVIPAPLWYILLLSAAIVMTYALFFADRAERALVQALMAGTVAAMLVTSLLVIRFFDHPYDSGPGSLQPTAMQRSLERIQHASSALGVHLTIPCDAAGQPLGPAALTP
jgi:hypothetical protein